MLNLISKERLRMELIGLYTPTAIKGISKELFKQKITDFSNEMEYPDNLEVKQEENLVLEMDYRDSANYRIPVSFILDNDGAVWVDEPEWYEDESEERTLFWERVYGLFGALPPEDVYA